MPDAAIRLRTFETLTRSAFGSSARTAATTSLVVGAADATCRNKLTISVNAQSLPASAQWALLNIQFLETLICGHNTV